MKTSAMEPSLNIEAFQILAQKFDDKDAKFLINWVEKKPAEIIEDSQRGFATKEDIYSVKQDIARLETKIESTSKQTIIWMFAMLVTLLSIAVTAIKFIK